MEISGSRIKSLEAPDYWSDFGFFSKDTPLLTQSLESNYVGLGMWFPEDLEDEQYDSRLKSGWMNHGLQLSIGFGEKVEGQPRMRFDYAGMIHETQTLWCRLNLPF